MSDPTATPPPESTSPTLRSEEPLIATPPGPDREHSHESGDGSDRREGHKHRGHHPGREPPPCCEHDLALHPTFAPLRLAGWIVGFTTLALALLALAAAHSFLDRLATQTREDVDAIRSALDTNQQATAVGVGLALPALLAIALGTASAAVFRGTAPGVDLARPPEASLLLQALVAAALTLAMIVVVRRARVRH